MQGVNDIAFLSLSDVFVLSSDGIMFELNSFNEFRHSTLINEMKPTVIQDALSKPTGCLQDLVYKGAHLMTVEPPSTLNFLAMESIFHALDKSDPSTVYSLPEHRVYLGKLISDMSDAGSLDLTQAKDYLQKKSMTSYINCINTTEPLPPEDAWLFKEQFVDLALTTGYDDRPSYCTSLS